MNQWIYEPEDNLLVYVGETQAIFIKLMIESKIYLQEIHDTYGVVLVSFIGEIEDLSSELKSLCIT